MTILEQFIGMVKKYHILKEFDDIELTKMGGDEKDLSRQSTGDRRIDNIINKIPQSNYPDISDTGEWVYRFLRSLDMPEMVKAVVDVFKGAKEPEHGAISSLGDTFKRTEVNKAGAKILYNLFSWMNESRKNMENFGKLIKMLPQEAIDGIRRNIKDYKGAMERSGVYQGEIEKFFRDLRFSGAPVGGQQKVGSHEDQGGHPYKKQFAHPHAPKQEESVVYSHLESIKESLKYRRLFG